MKQKRPTTKILLDTSRPLNNNQFSVRLRVTSERIQKFYAILDTDGVPMRLSLEEFKKIQPNARGKNKDLYIHLAAIEEEAQQIIDNLNPFSFDEFKKLFKGQKSKDENDVLNELLKRKKLLEDEGRISTASSLGCTYQSISKYLGKKGGGLPFENVTVDWLNKYEKWMYNHNNSSTTIGMYLRNVRTLFNDRIRNGKFDNLKYPFGRGKYIIPTGKNIKKALSKDHVRLIASYIPKTDSESFYRDLWLFSYYCNGMNIKDIAHLKHSDIHEDQMSFKRAKTNRALKSAPQIITVPKISPVIIILKRWSVSASSKDSYVFPILTKGLSPKEIYQKIQQTVKLTNKYIRRVAAEVGIEANVTTYVARHTYASVMKRSGASKEMIQESFGHKDSRTTENYLADFDLDEKTKWANKLI